MKANINILQHMKDSLEGNCTELTFWPQGKSFDEAVNELSTQDNIKRVFRMRTPVNPRDVYISTSEYDEVTELDLVNLAINHIETGSTIMEEAYMTEIQLRRIVDRTNQEEGKQLSDGDEIMTKDGKTISNSPKRPWAWERMSTRRKAQRPSSLRRFTFYTTSTSDLTQCSQ
jgi:hypothetical protein